MKLILLFLLSIFLLTACVAQPILVDEAVSPVLNSPSSTDTTQPLVIPTPFLPVEATPVPASLQAPPVTAVVETTPIPTLDPAQWQSWPVVPQGVSQRMREVYQRGLARGRDPRRFSKIGDYQNILPYFLGSFDSGDYRLGEKYAYLQSTIDHFAGSWGRKSNAVKGGMNVAAVQTLYFIDPENCGTNRSPMVCEIENHNPSIVILSFETWWGGKPAADYEKRLRSVVEYILSQDVVPILATKADNLEGDHSINAAIARVAAEYEIPLWNFWAAVQPLPARGLTEDGFHLTGLGAPNYFDDEKNMKLAWPWRNLTALQAIDAVYRSLNGLP